MANETFSLFSEDAEKPVESPQQERKPHARKVDTSFGGNSNKDEEFNHNFNNRSGHYNRPHRRMNNSNHDSNRNQEPLPLYEEEVILVNNPNDPNNPIKKRILKRVKQDDYYRDSEDYQDVYVLDDLE